MTYINKSTKELITSIELKIKRKEETIEVIKDFYLNNIDSSDLRIKMVGAPETFINDVEIKYELFSQSIIVLENNIKDLKKLRKKLFVLLSDKEIGFA